MQYFLALTLFVIPFYAWPFALFGVSVNMLILWLGLLWVVFAVWLWSRGKISEWMLSVRAVPRKFLIVVALFFVAGIVSLFVGGFSMEKLGQFIVLFFQPVVTFFVIRYVFQKFTNSKQIFITAAYVFVFASGLYAIIQYFTLVGVPMLWWGNDVEPKRALSFFIHPNFYALFVAPLLAFLIPETVSLVRTRALSVRTWFLLVCWIVGVAGLLFSLSRGGWLGLLFAAVAYLFFVSNKWLWWQGFIVVFAVINIAWAVPAVRYRIIAPFQGEKSASSRLTLWQNGWSQISDSPLLGQGLLGFSNNFVLYNSDKTLEQHPTPHNLFLHTWAETGILGLVSFIGVILYGLFVSIRNKKTPLIFGVGLAFVAMLVHGLVDTPYFKNDLAVLFWMLLALL